jgi:hypothetical protein
MDTDRPINPKLAAGLRVFSATSPKRVTQALSNSNKNAPTKINLGFWSHHPSLTGTSFARVFRQEQGVPMKAHSRTTVDVLPKSKKPKKKALKKPTAVSITERYLELRRLRERLSEAEALRSSQ